MTLSATKKRPLLIVTGLSGAGKSTALNVFEDLGYYSADGLPPALALALVELFRDRDRFDHPGLAVGIDTRRPEFVDEWLTLFDRLARLDVDPSLVFIDARPDVLIRRYAQTRRPHPMSLRKTESGELVGLETAVHNERKILEPLLSRADLVIDTSDLSIHDLRRALQDKWSSIREGGQGTRVHVITFGFKYGPPREADFLFDLRCLPNPYFVPELKPKSGRDRDVAEYVLKNDPGKGYLAKLIDFVLYSLPLFTAEGRFRLTIGVGCTGGRHRSVAAAEALAASVKNAGYPVSLEHRHLELG